MTIKDKGWPLEWDITNKYLILYSTYGKGLSGPETPRESGDGGPGRGYGPPTFFVARRKKGRKKGKGFKAETMKRLSLRSKYCFFSHSRASRIRKFSLSATGQPTKLWALS